MRRLAWRAFVYAAALGLAAQAVLPLLWMLSTSLKPPREVFATPPTFVPASPTLESFARLLGETAFLTYFRNSVVVAGLTVVLTMAVGALGAYSLTRFAFPGREAVARLILCTYMFAPIMIVIPIYILARRLGIVDTHAALVLSYASFCLPFSLWLLRAFFQSIRAPGPDRDVHLHVHAGVERLHLHPHPDRVGRAQDAPGRRPGPLRRRGRGLGARHGGGHADHDPRARVLHGRAAPSRGGLGHRRAQGVMDWV